MLSIADLPAELELSVQSQLVRGLWINGAAVDPAAAPIDSRFDLSYRRIPVVGMLRTGENTIELETDEPKPLPFLPTVILWGRFAVDPQGRIVRPPKTVALGDWRKQGYPSLSGIGRCRHDGVGHRPENRSAWNRADFPLGCW